jgi:HK97 family phage major capsid protein
MADELKQILDAQDALGRAWDEFKKTNDERLKVLETKSGAGDFEAKLARIEQDILKFSGQVETLQKKANRPLDVGNVQISEQEMQHKAAIFGAEGYMRKGENGQAIMEHKTMLAGNDPNGGYALPAPTMGAIQRVAMDQVAMYGLATVTPIGGGGWSEPVVTAGMTAGHVGETGTRSATTTPTLAKVDIQPEETYVNAPVYNKLLDDAEFDIEAWLVTEAGYSFADLDDTDFITGTGINSARGIAAYTMIADASYAWGKTGFVVTGKSAAFADTDPADVFIDIEGALKTKYHANARYLMNRSTLTSTRKLKDGMGNYLWQPGLVAGVPNLINGYPYAISDNMTAISASTYSIAFGDFRAAYRIVTRRGMTILRDPYTTKGLTYFYISKRLGGGIKNFEAVKFMKFST